MGIAAGAFAEVVVAHHRHVIRLPDGLSLEAAATQPTALTTEHGARESADQPAAERTRGAIRGSIKDLADRRRLRIPYLHMASLRAYSVAIFSESVKTELRAIRPARASYHWLPLSTMTSGGCRRGEGGAVAWHWGIGARAGCCSNASRSRA